MTQPLSDPTFPPSAVADITDATIDPPALPAPPRSRSRLLLIMISSLVLLAVAGAGFAGGFLVGRPAVEKYTVWVYLKMDANDSAKVEVRTALERLHPDGAIRFVTREQAMAKAKVTFRDAPAVLEHMTQENLPESFEADLATRALTCKGISSIRDLAGADDVKVARRYHDSVPGAEIGC